MKINEIFYSIQGEGANAGRPAIFIRFSGCNLLCPFCDTRHQSYKEMSTEEVLREVRKYPCDFIVLTGGEPTLQITSEFLSALEDYEIALETNGTRPVPKGVDWVTCSPKNSYISSAKIRIEWADEVKYVIDEECPFPAIDELKACYHYIQPCDTGDAERNKRIQERCVKFVKNNPRWKLSIQLQKILNIR